MTATLTTDFYRRKVADIQARLGAEGLTGLLLLEPYNVIYACGFFHIPSERPLGLYVPASGAPTLFVPLLEVENAGESWIGDIRAYFEYPAEEHPVLWMLREIGERDIGIDRFPYDVPASQFRDGIRASTLVDRMRWVKEPEELALVEQAARYADYCLEQARDHAGAIIRDGGTELDILNHCLGETRRKIKAEVGEVFRLYGGSVVGTAHSGPRAALPHGSPIERRPQPGEPLIVGIGTMVGGYHAESGATFIVGEPTGDQMRCLEVAAACDEATVRALRPGALCAEVNEAALDVLREAGFGAYIRHRIGHGIGLQAHEGPWLAPGDRTPLVPNMVFSSEPGIYRPGLDGYRTINTMIVSEGAARVPSRFLAENPPERRILAVSG